MERPVGPALPPQTVRAFALAAGPAALVSLPLSIYLPPFIAAGGVIPVGIVGIMFSLCTLWDGVIDPAIGTIIDRVRAGPAPHRRWMRIAALPLALLLAIIVIAGNKLPLLLLLPCLLLFYSSASLFEVAHLAWGSALAARPADSARLFGMREWLTKFLLVAAFAVPAAAQIAIPGLSLQGRIMSYASLMLLAMPIALWAIARLPARLCVPEQGMGWAHELASTVRFRPLILVIFVQFLNAFSFGALTSLFVFYADGVLELDRSSSVMLFGVFVGGAIFTPVWTWAARRFGKPGAMMMMGAWLVLVLAASFAVTSGDLIEATLYSTVLGSGFVGLIFIHGMIADLAPEDRRRCGRDRTAFLYAICNVLQKAGVASAIAVSYFLLDLLGFDASRARDFATEIHWLFAGLPSLSWGLMIVLLLPLVREPALALRADSH